MEKELVKKLKLKTGEEPMLLSFNGKVSFYGVKNSVFRLMACTEISCSNFTNIALLKREYNDFVKRAEFFNLTEVKCDDDLRFVSFNENDRTVLKLMCFNRDYDIFKQSYEDDVIIPCSLVNTIKDVGRSASVDETRYFMNGIFFAENGDIVATDGRRLTLKTSPFKFNNLIIPVHAFSPFNGKNEIYVKIFKGREQTYLKLNDGEHTVYVETLYGQFPNYKKAIPEEKDVEEHFAKGMKLFSINRKLFSKKINHCKIINGSDVRFCSEYDEGIELGKIEYPIDQVFNGNYLADIAEVHGSDLTVKIHKEDSKYRTRNQMSTVFGNKDFFTVVMPLAIDE